MTEWNAKATEVSGYSKAQTIDKHLVNTFIHLDHRAAVSEVLEKALTGEDVANFELHLFTRDGQRREILLNATPRKGDDGSVIGVLGVGQDSAKQIISSRREFGESWGLLVFLRIPEDILIYVLLRNFQRNRSGESRVGN